MKHDDNIYIKSANGRYYPIGCRNIDYLHDGIWYVRHTEHSKHTSNCKYLEGLYKVGDAPGKIDIPKLCAMDDYKEYVLNSKEFEEIRENGTYTWNDLVAKITALVVDLNEKYKNNEKSVDDNICRF